MSQILIPLGALSFLALLVYAFVREARKQREAARRIFEELAQRRGWRFDPVDDGTVQAASTGMEAIGCFVSPSLGKVEPCNVVSGTVPEGRVLVYEHSRRITEGDSRHWTICLIETDEPVGSPAVIRVCPGGRTSRFRNSLYAGEALPLPPAFHGRLVVYARQPELARHELPTDLLESVQQAAATLPFRVDLQIHDWSVAVYPGERNVSFESIESVEPLLELAREAVRILRTRKVVGVR